MQSATGGGRGLGIDWRRRGMWLGIVPIMMVSEWWSAGVEFDCRQGNTWQAEDAFLRSVPVEEGTEDFIPCGCGPRQFLPQPL